MKSHYVFQFTLIQVINKSIFHLDAKIPIFKNNHITWNAADFLPTNSSVVIFLLTWFFIPSITLCGVENHFFCLILIRHPSWEQILFNVTGVVSLWGVKYRVLVLMPSRIAITEFATSVFDDWFWSSPVLPFSLWSIDFEFRFGKEAIKFCLGLCASAPKIHNRCT